VRSALFEQAVLTGDVRFLTSQTIYARSGDAFVYACLAATLAALALAIRWGKMGRRERARAKAGGELWR
jgi:apolipoprotein N-acyltransferase